MVFSMSFCSDTKLVNAFSLTKVRMMLAKFMRVIVMLNGKYIVYNYDSASKNSLR